MAGLVAELKPTLATLVLRELPTKTADGAARFVWVTEMVD